MRPNPWLFGDTRPRTDEVYRPGLGLYAAAVFAGLVILVVQASANFGLQLVAFVFGMPLWIGLPIAWVALLGRDAVRSRLHMSGRTWARWLGLPALGILCLALVATSAPFRARFELSRSDFDQAASQLLAGRSVSPGRIGLFEVDFVESLPNGLLFVDLSMGFINPCGLAFAPAGQPEVDFVGTELGGGWWVACERF